MDSKGEFASLVEELVATESLVDAHKALEIALTRNTILEAEVKNLTKQLLEERNMSTSNDVALLQANTRISELERKLQSALKIAGDLQVSESDATQRLQRALSELSATKAQAEEAKAAQARADSAKASAESSLGARTAEVVRLKADLAKEQAARKAAEDALRRAAAIAIDPDEITQLNQKLQEVRAQWGTDIRERDRLKTESTIKDTKIIQLETEANDKAKKITNLEKKLAASWSVNVKTFFTGYPKWAWGGSVAMIAILLFLFVSGVEFWIPSGSAEPKTAVAQKAPVVAQATPPPTPPLPSPSVTMIPVVVTPTPPMSSTPKVEPSATPTPKAEAPATPTIAPTSQPTPAPSPSTTPTPPVTATPEPSSPPTTEPVADTPKARCESRGGEIRLGVCSPKEE